MKNKKNILATVFTLIFALGVVTLSAAAATTNSRENDPVETLPEIVSVNSHDDCGAPSIENFVRNLDTLTVEEKAALLADLGEIAKLEKQIHRHKTRLEKSLRYDDASPEYDDYDDEDEGPHIVRVKRFSMNPMSVEEAMLQLELLGHSFFVFTNAETDRINVIYARKDGNFGLIEPDR